MRGARSLLFLVALLATAGCARQSQPTYVMMIDPATGQQVAVMQQPAAATTQPQYVQQQPQYAQASQPQSAQPQYAQAPQQQAAQQQAAPQAAAADRPRGLFTRPAAASYGAANVGGPYVPAPSAAAPSAYALAAPVYNEPYTLDAGDRLRVVVFGQDGISNSYIVDAGGNITLPLIGTVSARGYTTQQLAQTISERLKHGYVREPHVSVEIEQARPFFILGEVTLPGQYPYIANMTVETAIAVAGGFGPRASKSKVQLTRNLPGQQMRADVPLNFPLRPGDTLVVKERWF